MIIPRYRNLWRGIVFSIRFGSLFILFEDDFVIVRKLGLRVTMDNT